MKKFKFPYNTRSSEQMSREYKDHVVQFSNKDASPLAGRMMK